MNGPLGRLWLWLSLVFLPGLARYINGDTVALIRYDNLKYWVLDAVVVVVVVDDLGTGMLFAWLGT